MGRESEVLSRNPISYWRLGDTGTTCFDSAGVQNGSYIGSPAAVDFRPPVVDDGHYSTLFSGQYQAAVIPDNAAHRGLYDFAMEAWVYCTSNSGYGYIFSKWGQSFPNDDYWEIAIFPSAASIRFSFGQNVSGVFIVDKGYLRVNTWHQVIYARSGSQFYAFLDGEKLLYEANLSGQMNNNPNNPCYIGWGTYKVLEYFKGYIAEVSLYNHIFFTIPDLSVDTSSLYPYPYGNAPLTVTFSGTSYGTATSWEWDFGDGGPTSTDQNPTHTYNTPGVYSVALTVSRTGYSHTKTKENYINVFSSLTLEAVSKGMLKPIDFTKSSYGNEENFAAFTTGVPCSLLYIGGTPHGSWHYAGPIYTGDTPEYVPRPWPIVDISPGYPSSTITVNGHPWSTGDLISIEGSSGLGNGLHVITKTGTNTFTVYANIAGFITGFASGRINAGGAGASGYPLTSLLYGQIPFSNTKTKNTYLARFQAQARQTGTLLLCDRLWHNGGLSSTFVGQQNFVNSVQIPPRDAYGTSDGVGVYAAVETIGTTTSDPPSITFKYTNTKGVSGRTAGWILSPTTTTSFSFLPIGLATGDLGVQKAESINFSSGWTSGSPQIFVVLYRVLARLDLRKENIANAIDAITSGFPRLYYNSVPFLVFIPSAAQMITMQGQIIWAQG